VVVGIETDRGMWVASLVAAGYQVYAINPKAVSRYRDRHVTSGAKSDPRDARVLADLVRTDRHLHRPSAGDSELAEAIRVLARAHQRLVWDRQRQVNGLRSALREFYPAALVAFGTDLTHPDALAVLIQAPTPAQGRALSRSALAALRGAGRKRNIEARARALHQALRSPQLQAPDTVASAFGASVSASIGVIAEMNRQLQRLEAELEQAFDAHPDAEIIRSQPGLGVILGARVQGEFGDDPTRYQHAKSRRCYAGTAPITKASGSRKIVLARFMRTATWPTPATGGRSARSAPPPGRARSTTPIVPAATPTIRRCERSAIAWSGSWTAASAIAPPTTRTRPGATATTASSLPPPRTRDCGQPRLADLPT
jgi:transposase